jgi:molybdopterin molybdotransferase
MITVEEAKNLIITNVKHLAIQEIDVIDSLGYYLAEQIIAPIYIPSFDQSAMDGYAFCYEDKDKSVEIIDEVAAGDTRQLTVEKGKAVRIFTGSKIPKGADTVVMQELTVVNNNFLTINDTGLRLGGNIRVKGSQIKKGDIALDKGTKLTEAAIGFISALGLTKVKVYDLPKVAIIATGDELIKPGNELEEGQIFESNTFMLEAALNKLMIKPTITVVKDNQKETEKAIEQAINDNDLLLLSGGISVGDYDFVKESLENLGVKDVFYKIKQKPGKPLFFGKTNSCYVFALPGNPAAALSCFYQYTYPSINLMMGGSDVYLPRMKLPIAKQLIKKEGRSVFFKAFTDFNKVTVLEGQGSDMLKSFALANCFVYVQSEISFINQNELVEVHLFP